MENQQYSAREGVILRSATKDLADKDLLRLRTNNTFDKLLKGLHDEHFRCLQGSHNGGHRKSSPSHIRHGDPQSGSPLSVKSPWGSSILDQSEKHNGHERTPEQYRLRVNSASSGKFDLSEWQKEIQPEVASVELGECKSDAVDPDLVTFDIDDNDRVPEELLVEDTTAAPRTTQWSDGTSIKFDAEVVTFTSNDDEEEDFIVRYAWQEKKLFKQSRSSVGLEPRRPKANKSLRASNMADEAENALRGQGWDRFVLHPNAKRLMAWDFLGAILITYDMVVVPLSTFDFDDNSLTNVMDWLARIIWTLDLCLSPVRGYFDKGNCIITLAETVKKYMRTWLSLDISLVFADWSLLFLDSTQDSSDTGSARQVLKMARLFRMLRLLRLFKLQRLFTSIAETISTEAFSIYFKFTKPLVGILFLIHWMACGWYGIGNLGKDGNFDHTWFDTSDVLHQGKGYVYCACLHWSLSHFTLSSIDVHAQNAWERLYTISVLFFGIVAFSTLIGGFTSAVEELREIRSDETKQFWLLRCFIRDYSISQKLHRKIYKHCEYAYIKNKTCLQIKDVRLLGFLSTHLSEKLHREIYSPQLAAHPLFQRMKSMKCKSLNKVCMAPCLRSQSHAQGDVIFDARKEADCMIVLVEGSCNYTKETGEGGEVSLVKDDWMCEAILWVDEWFTCGRAKITAPSRTLHVDAKLFEDIFADKDLHEWNFLQRYAVQFVTELRYRAQNDEPIDDLLRNEENLDTGLVYTPQEKKDNYLSRLILARVTRNSNTSAGSQYSAGNLGRVRNDMIRGLNNMLGRVSGKNSVEGSQESMQQSGEVQRKRSVRKSIASWFSSNRLSGKGSSEGSIDDAPRMTFTSSDLGSSTSGERRNSEEAGTISPEEETITL